MFPSNSLQLADNGNKITLEKFSENAPKTKYLLPKKENSQGKILSTPVTPTLVPKRWVQISLFRPLPGSCRTSLQDFPAQPSKLPSTPSQI